MCKAIKNPLFINNVQFKFFSHVQRVELSYVDKPQY